MAGFGARISSGYNSPAMYQAALTVFLARREDFGLALFVARIGFRYRPVSREELPFPLGMKKPGFMADALGSVNTIGFEPCGI